MFKNFINRIFRAIKIDVELYEEVERDKSATIQAGFVVVLSSMAAGVGALQLGASNFLLAPIFSLISCSRMIPLEIGKHQNVRSCDRFAIWAGG